MVPPSPSSPAQGKNRRHKYRSITDINVRYSKLSSLIPRDPSAPMGDDNILRVTVPQYLQTVQDAIDKNAFSTKAIHTLFQLRQVVEKNKHLRQQLASLNGFTETLCQLLVHQTNLSRRFVRGGTVSDKMSPILGRTSSPGSSRGTRQWESPGFGNTRRAEVVISSDTATDGLMRCQQHSIAIFNCIMLIDPHIDAYILAHDNFIPGIGMALTHPNSESQELAGICLDYASVAAEHKTILCTSDTLLHGIEQVLINTRSTAARFHVLQALACLSQVMDGKFIIARRPDMLDALSYSLTFMDENPKVVLLVMRILSNLCQLKENIPLISRNSDLCSRITVVYEGMEQIVNEHEMQSQQASFQETPREFATREVCGDWHGMNTPQSEAQVNDMEVLQYSQFVTKVLSLYERRLNTDAIMSKLGWWSNGPMVFYGQSCVSMLDSPHYRAKFRRRGRAHKKEEVEE